VRAIEAGNLEESIETEGGGEAVDLVLRDAKLTNQQIQGDRVHVIGDFEANRGTKASTQQLSFESLNEVLALVLIDLHIFIPGHTELVVFKNFHPREKFLDVIRNQVLNGDIAQSA